MNEKKFTAMAEFNGFTDIYYNNHVICSVRTEYADNIINLLNKQEERIKELETELKKFKPVIFKTENGDKTLYEKGGIND